MDSQYEFEEDVTDILIKQQSLAQRIDEDGLAIFNSSLPRSDTLSVTFNKQSDNDFGIDGELQILVDRHITGEKYKVQLKSSENVKYLKGSKIVSFSLDVRSAYSLIKVEKVPTSLIVIDTVQSRVFWLAIQIDQTVAESLSSILKKKIAHAKRKKIDTSAKKKMLDEANITIHIPIEQELTPLTFEPLRDALKSSALEISKREVIATREKSLITGLKNISEIEGSILQLEGFDIVHRSPAANASPSAMMSVMVNKDKAVDFVPNQSFVPDLAPKISFNATFNRDSKEELALAEAFSRVIRGQAETITLKGKNIKSFTATSGKTLIDSISDNDNLMITISPYVNKVKQDLVISNETDQLTLKSEIWHDSEKLYISSDSSEPIEISMELKLNPSQNSDGFTETTAHFTIHDKNFLSASHQLRVMNFVKQSTSTDIGFVGPDGFRNHLFEGADLNKALPVPEGLYNLVVMLTEFEAKIGQRVKYPLPEKITPDMVRAIRMARDSLYGGWDTQNATLKFGIQDDKKHLASNPEGQYMELSFGVAEFNILNQKFQFEGYEKVIQGKVKSIESITEGTYTHKIIFEESSMITRPIQANQA